MGLNKNRGRVGYDRKNMYGVGIWGKEGCMLDNKDINSLNPNTLCREKEF